VKGHKVRLITIIQSWPLLIDLGMFLYAYLTVENLLQQHTIGSYEEELRRNLPDNLADA
jgi:hypothetical protein